MAVDPKAMWLQYMQMLETEVSPEAGEAMQAAYPFIPWAWGGQSPVADSYPYEQWQLLNVVPADPLQNTNANAPASQSGFDIAYSNWFNMLAIGDLDHDQQYQQYQDAFTQASNKLTTDYANVTNVWQNETGGAGKFDAWLNDPSQAGYKAQLDEDSADLDGKQSELDDYRQRTQTPVKAIVAAYNNASYQGQVTDPNTGKSVTLRIWATTPGNPWNYVMQITNNTFGHDATAGTRGSITFNRHSDTYEYEEQYGEAEAALWGDFIFALGGEGSFEQIDWSDFSEDWEISVNWQDLVKVVVTPDPWYADTNIATYGPGPYATGFSEFQSGPNKYFFGPGGALCRRYSGFIACYRPTVKITAGSSFASYLYQKFQQGSGIQIGPFFFGSETTIEHQTATAETQGDSITISSNDDWPMIVGMLSKWTLAPAT